MNLLKRLINWLFAKRHRFVDKIILHCSASDLEGQTASMIDSWHKKRGFKKIGYHYFIEKCGVRGIGRLENEIGAHVLGYNKSSIGICLAGEHNFTRYQFNALYSLLIELKQRYPKATLHGHKEFTDKKTCPNFEYDLFRAYWNSL